MRMSTFAAAALPMAVFANRLAPLSKSSSHIANEYIVMLHDSSNLFADSGALKILKEEPRYTWTTALKGFSATMDAQTLEAMRQHPDVQSITENGITRAAGWSDADGPPADVLASMGEVGESPNPNPTNNIASDWLSQEKPTWGLARVSNKAPKGTTYEYHKSQGEGVCAWIVDTGVAADIPDFEGRAENVHNVIKGEKNTDLHNHGTHCAGTVASKTYGVAKKAFIRSIKVLGASASGPDDGVVEAINWLAENGPKREECKKGHVVNMSFTADKIHAPMKAACAKLVELGMHVAVASGNGNRDASKDSPGDEPMVCNVAATDNVSVPCHPQQGREIERERDKLTRSRTGRRQGQLLQPRQGHRHQRPRNDDRLLGQGRQEERHVRHLHGRSSHLRPRRRSHDRKGQPQGQGRLRRAYQDGSQGRAEGPDGRDS